jgi:hypothetical protein
MFWGLIVGLLIGCGGGGGSFDTNRDALIAIGDAFCSRGAECGEIGSDEVQACVDVFVDAGCAEVDCNTAPQSSNEDIDDCVSALSDLSCTAENLPAVCNSIL